MAVLLSNMLEWQHQQERRGDSLRNAIMGQRNKIANRINETSSLKAEIMDADFWP